MTLRSCIALLLLVSACATTAPSPAEPLAPNPRLANLQRAAYLPWLDEGRCIVQEASQPMEVMMERCYHALDTRRVRFQDSQGTCSVASVGAAAVPAMVAICLLAQPVAVGVVIVIGTVVVAAAIQEELAAHARWRRAHPEEEASREVARPRPQQKPATEEPLANGRPRPEGLGRDWFPPEPPESSLGPRERRPECTPRRVPPKGGHPFHNACADNVPHNAFRGANALVNGKAFDALQPATRTLWEVKTDNFDTYTPELQRIVVQSQVTMLRSERDLAMACGFDFRAGVRSEAHKEALEEEAPDLIGFIVVMDWC
jgi:hypothetical protein